MDFSKWTSNSDFKESLNNYYACYINQFPKKYKNIIEKVLSNLDYYDEDKFDEICKQYDSGIINDIAGKTFFITTVLDNQIHNSSIFYCRIQNTIKNIENLTYQENYSIKYKNADNFVICDDYSCSGDTMLKVVKCIYDMYPDIEDKKVNIIFYPAICCREAIENIIQKMNSHFQKFNYSIKSVVNRECGFLTKKNIFSKEELEGIDCINEYCCIPNKYQYGYNNSEELMSMYYGTPNNTIGFLWYDSNQNNIKPFFSRTYKGFWFKDNGKFSFNYYKDQKFVKDLIKDLLRERNLNMDDRKILVYILLGYDNIKLNSIFDEKKVIKCVKKLIQNKYLKYDMTKGKKVNQNIYDRIIRYKLNLDASSQGNIEMNLLSLKHK